MFTLDNEFNNNESHIIFIPPIIYLTYFKGVKDLHVHYFKIKEDDGDYYSINSIQNLINKFRTLQTCLYEPINSTTLSKINKLYLKNLHNIFQLNINILKKKLELITNNNIKEIRNILTYKLEFETVIKIDFINLHFLRIFKSEINYTNYDYITYKDKIKEICGENEKESKYKKFQEKWNIEKENQMMYMNDPYIIKLKLNVIDYYPKKIQNRIFRTYSSAYDIYENSIAEYYDWDTYVYDLGTAVRIFNNRRKTNEHFRDKSTKYNYQDIKNRNKQLNQEFKRVYKLISKNIGFNLISQ